uniref:Uncharacterized protein MANES_11G036700 n=1 Tax=Rhizophora mucronata TaxID=61149 RepID=A0A2P2JJC1_RHIMU
MFRSAPGNAERAKFGIKPIKPIEPDPGSPIKRRDADEAPIMEEKRSKGEERQYKTEKKAGRRSGAEATELGETGHVIGSQ